MLSEEKKSLSKQVKSAVRQKRRIQAVAKRLNNEDLLQLMVLRSVAATNVGSGGSSSSSSSSSTFDGASLESWHRVLVGVTPPITFD